MIVMGIKRRLREDKKRVGGMRWGVKKRVSEEGVALKRSKKK